MTVKQLFKAGDVVRYIPMGKKEFTLEESGDEKYPLKLSDCNEILLSDGRYADDHTHPLIVLIRRPEQKKKWYQVFYKYTEEEGGGVFCSSSLYTSEEDFYSRRESKDKLEWIELKFVCER